VAGGMIRLLCPNLKCRRVLAVPDSARGRAIRCGACGTSVRVPDSSPAKPAEPDTQPASPGGKDGQ